MPSAAHAALQDGEVLTDDFAPADPCRVTPMGLPMQ